MRMSELDIPKSQFVSLADDYVYIARNKELFLKKIDGYTYEELAEMYNLSAVVILFAFPFKIMIELYNVQKEKSTKKKTKG